ncbi:MAG: hypothetical protein IJ660_02925 [Alphaproteobacteria bacterium]|jgi:hypothetical protein|nr:hypothetical protein [Alphaproteobacteria bacterium]
MSDISKLLKEAKPLYYVRKKHRKQIQMSMLALLCVGILSFSYRPADLNFNIDEELYLTETGGAIEELGLPTDDYGFLKVS